VSLLMLFCNAKPGRRYRGRYSHRIINCIGLLGAFNGIKSNITVNKFYNNTPGYHSAQAYSMKARELAFLFLFIFNSCNDSAEKKGNKNDVSDTTKKVTALDTTGSDTTALQDKTAKLQDSFL